MVSQASRHVNLHDYEWQQSCNCWHHCITATDKSQPRKVFYRDTLCLANLYTHILTIRHIIKISKIL